MTRPPAAVARVAALQVDFRGPVVPYVRVGQERWTPRATRYFASKDNIALAVKLAMQQQGAAMFGERVPFEVEAIFYRRNIYTCDGDNLLKALLDAAQGVLYLDDRFCVDMKARKVAGEAGFIAVFREATVFREKIE